jgi:hypothetical protein
MVMHKYKVDAVVTIIKETTEQLGKLKEIFPTLEEIVLDISDDEKQIILKELETLETTVKFLLK